MDIGEDTKYGKFSVLESSSYAERTADMTGSAGRTTANETDLLLQKAEDSLTYKKLLHRRLWVTATFLNIGSALVFTGQIILSPIYSSIYGTGLGVLIMALFTGSGIVGSVASNLVLQKLGCKETLVFTGLCYMITLMANFYPTWQLLVPCALVAGFCISIFVMVMRTYLGKQAQSFSSAFQMDSDRIHSRMFVFHVLFIKAIAIFGNLGSALILGTAPTAAVVATEIEPFEFLVIGNRSEYVPVVCGIDYCNEDLGPGYEPTRVGDSATVSIAAKSQQFFSVAALCVLAAFVGTIIIALFVEKLKSTRVANESNPTKSTSKLVVATFAQLKDPRLLLLLPLAVSQPCGDAFWVADFNKAFVTCTSGIQYVGYVAMWSGISGAVSCFAFGWFNKKSLRSLPLTVASLAHISVLLVLFRWRPKDDSLLEMSAVTAIWFLGSGIKLSLVPALFGVVFSDNIEVAFSNLNLWTYIGSMLVFAWSHYLCMDVKMYILLGMLVTSYIGYIAVEIVTNIQKDSIFSLSDSIGRVNSIKAYCIIK